MSGNSDLTLTEQKHVRTAIWSLRVRVGGWTPLAKALRFQYDTVQKVAAGARAVTAGMALRVARFAGVSIDDLLAGNYTPPGTCPHCGHAPDFTDETTQVDG